MKVPVHIGGELPVGSAVGQPRFAPRCGWLKILHCPGCGLTPKKMERPTAETRIRKPFGKLRVLNCEIVAVRRFTRKLGRLLSVLRKIGR